MTKKKRLARRQGATKTVRQEWQETGVDVTDATAGTEVLHAATGYQGHHLCAHCGVSFETTVGLHAHLDDPEGCGMFLKKHGVKRARGFDQTLPDEPAPTPEQQWARSRAVVAQDHQQRAVLETERREGCVYYLSRAPEGLSLERETAPEADFDQRYKPIADYPTGRAARLFVGVARAIGGSIEAMTELAKLIHITPEEIEMATSKAKTVATMKKPAGFEAFSKPGKPAKEKATTPPTAARPAPTSIAKGSVAKPKAAPKGAPKVTAASMFRELLLKGTLTDDQIFAKVQATLGIADKCRSHVAWYRADMRKKGQKVPDAKK